MSLSQMNPQLNDAFEVYYRNLGPISRWAYCLSSVILHAVLKSRKWLFSGRLLANERIVEYPKILQWIKPEGTTLDIGCVSSRLPIQLASLGYRAHCLDNRPYPFSHPNLTFHRADMLEWTPPETFDTITMISVLEHVGLGAYGDTEEANADKIAVRRISSWLKSDGQFLVSVPFGKGAVYSRYRVYDAERLRFVFGDLEWANVQFYARNNDSWEPTTMESLQEVSSETMPCNGVVLLDLRKK